MPSDRPPLSFKELKFSGQRLVSTRTAPRDTDLDTHHTRARVVSCILSAIIVAISWTLGLMPSLALGICTLVVILFFAAIQLTSHFDTTLFESVMLCFINIAWISCIVSVSLDVHSTWIRLGLQDEPKSFPTITIFLLVLMALLLVSAGIACGIGLSILLTERRFARIKSSRSNNDLLLGTLPGSTLKAAKVSGGGASSSGAKV